MVKTSASPSAAVDPAMSLWPPAPPRGQTRARTCVHGRQEGALRNRVRQLTAGHLVRVNTLRAPALLVGVTVDVSIRRHNMRY